ncbi:MAG: hypothetical protein KF819_26935 [Labilithrix sp.]|nr:hypothetical protein [Labilithrix sp.]
MRSFFAFGVCFVTSALLWVGCSDTTTESGNPEGGTTPEGGNGNDGGGGDSSPAVDSGVDSAAPPLTGPFIPLKYGAANCPAFTPCGGDPKGMWNLKDGCVTEEIFAGAKGQCPGLTESDVNFEARGYVLVDAVTATRKTEVKFSAKFAVPQACKAAVGTCANIATALKLGGLDTATCADDAGTSGCDCDVGDLIAETTSDTYTTNGNVLTTGSAGTARTYEYCVAGAGISYKETTANAAPATLFLEK